MTSIRLQGLRGSSALAAAAAVTLIASVDTAQGQATLVRTRGPVQTFTSTSGGGGSSNLGTFDIVINPGSGLSSNPAALAAFNRAAAQWESRIADGIVVNINADVSPLPAGVLGSTNATFFQGTYGAVRGLLVPDAADEPDDAIVGALPATFTSSNLALPANFSFSGNVLLTKANLKAIGFDPGGPEPEGTITFSSNFTFDYNNDDGVAPGAIDFESVAAHEIGHALGFVSEVDTVDTTFPTAQQPASVGPAVLDLFRFDNDGAEDPSTVANFTSFRRSMIPGNDEITDEIASELRMSTGALKGDGRQASHWKDDGLTGIYLGLMDPNLAAGVFVDVMENDFRAIDLIGYEVLIPEPTGALSLALAGAATLLRRRGRRA